MVNGQKKYLPLNLFFCCCIYTKHLYNLSLCCSWLWSYVYTQREESMLLCYVTFWNNVCKGGRDYVYPVGLWMWPQLIFYSFVFLPAPDHLGQINHGAIQMDCRAGWLKWLIWAMCTSHSEHTGKQVMKNSLLQVLSTLPISVYYHSTLRIQK